MTIDAVSEGSSPRVSSLAPGRRRPWLPRLLAMLLGILAAGLAASQRVAKLVQEDNDEEGEILRHIPKG